MKMEIGYMVKKALMLCCIPLLLSAGEIRKDYYFSTPSVKDGIAYLEGCRTIRKAFAPSVAVKPVRLYLPYGQKAFSYKVE